MPSRWTRLQPLPFLGCLALAALGLAGPACSKGASEPEPDRPAETAAPAPAVPPLAFDPPPGWVPDTAGKGGDKKATFKVPKIGNDKEDVEVTVWFFGTGALGDPDRVFADWLGLFDGDVAHKAPREKLDVKGTPAEVVEVAGTYKIPLGPAVGPKKKTPMQMVKENFRLRAAVLRTKDRGNWFVRMVGPDETVQSARSALQTFLESAR